MYDLFEVRAFMFLKNSLDKYLFMHNTQKGSIIKGYVNPPAGHVEKGETLIETVRREVEEETGITNTKKIRLKGVISVVGFSKNPVLLLVVVADVPEDQIPKKKKEGEPVWISFDDLVDYKMLKDVEWIIDLLQSTPDGEVFHAKSKFKDKEMVSFESEPVGWSPGKKIS